MRIDSSGFQYLAFASLLASCFFDPQGAAPAVSQPDGSVAGPSGSGGVGGTTAAGTGSESGTGAISGGGGAGMSGVGGAGAGGASGTGGAEPPPPTRVDGEDCTEDAVCQSGHCDGICCAKGNECCKRPADCPSAPGGEGTTCDDPANCNGTTGRITCSPDFTCRTIDGAPNDTACNETIEASDCGPYKPVVCTGAEQQDSAPSCPTSCAGDGDCDSSAHCDNQCVADLPIGQKCDEPTDCTSALCGQNGVCCGPAQQALGIDCCNTAADCPSKYSWAPKCNDAATCQGTSGTAICVNNACGTTTMQDDSACGATTQCGMYAPVVCTMGMRNQTNKRCASSCQNSSTCVDSAYCANSRCVPRLPDGMGCTEDRQCQTGCGDNGICCNGNECCITVGDCMKRGLTCGMQCQGTRKKVDCASNTCVERNETVQDDSACAAPTTFVCAPYRNLTCNGIENQAPCLTACTPGNSNECEPPAVCRADGTCGPAAPGPAGMSGGAGMGGMGGM